MYFAHSLENKSDQSIWHRLEDHLIATGDGAEAYAREFGAGNAARLAGMLHDLGKYSSKFQERLNGSAEAVDHSTAGAQEILKLNYSDFDKITAELISYAIAGHHAGLADYQTIEERRAKVIEIIDDVWKKEINVNIKEIWPALNLSPNKAAFQLAFLGRMIFSCLVDADYKDTEKFYAKYEARAIDRDWPDLRGSIDLLITRFDSFMLDKQEKAPSNFVNNLRKEILQHVRSRAQESTGLFTLTVPTGGGKTLASLGFALDHAKAHNLRRIIYAIPFTSIIDQNAAVFRSVLGGDYILEHHASIDQKKFVAKEQRDKLRLAMEDWAAPVIVTTNVQFFESLFANRPSHCRKLHNLTNSVIILDEAQTIPLNLLRPCLAALDELAKNYGSTIILCTATQPALDMRDFQHGGLELQGRELAPNPQELSQQLKRVHITTGHILSDEELVQALSKHEQALIIVNTRKHALELYNQAKQEGLEGLVHLTTRQYAVHRRIILDRVRALLSEGRPCRLIATSLIEAGVDVDFPRVWRAEAGLDQIAQAAGRCNREGKYPSGQSIVTVFQSPDNSSPREIKQLAADFMRIAGQYDDLLSPDAIRAYFKEVFWRKGAEQLDKKGILSQFKSSNGRAILNYQTVALDFQMIESSLVPIIINDTPIVAGILCQLNSNMASLGRIAQELQPYIVQVPARDRNSLMTNGRIMFFREDLWGEQFAVLQDVSLYEIETGLIWENADVLTDTIF